MIAAESENAVLMEALKQLGATLALQNSVLDHHGALLDAGALAMQKLRETAGVINETTQATNGKVKELRSEYDTTKTDVAIIMAERKARIVTEETEKLRASVTAGYAMIKLPSWKQILTVIAAMGTIGLAITEMWPCLVWLWSHR